MNDDRDFFHSDGLPCEIMSRPDTIEMRDADLPS